MAGVLFSTGLLTLKHTRRVNAGYKQQHKAPKKADVISWAFCVVYAPRQKQESGAFRTPSCGCHAAALRS